MLVAHSCVTTPITANYLSAIRSTIFLLFTPYTRLVTVEESQKMVGLSLIYRLSAISKFLSYMYS